MRNVRLGIVFVFQPFQSGFPDTIFDIIFCVNFCFENIRQLFSFFHWNRLRELKRNIVQKSHDDDSLTLLWYAKIERVQNLGVDMISQCFQMFFHDYKSLSAIVGFQIPDIFQHESRRTLFFQDSLYLKKQRTTGFICKTLSFSDNRKSLTWKTCQKDIEVRNILCFDFCNVTRGNFTKICRIGFARIRVNFRGKDTISSHRFKSQPYSSNTCKQINKRKMVPIHQFLLLPLLHFIFFIIRFYGRFCKKKPFPSLFRQD